jgi:hypothetical protein
LLKLGSRKKNQVPAEITALLIVHEIDSNDPSDLIPGMDIRYMLKLDEGHDRPVWVWVQNSDQDVDPKNISPLVPEMPETILEDGLLLLIAEGLKDEGLRASLNNRRSGKNRLYDLNLPTDGDFGSIRAGIPEALEAVSVKLVRFKDCTIKPEQAEAMGLEVVSF